MTSDLHLPSGFADQGPWVDLLPHLWRGMQEYANCSDERPAEWSVPPFPGTQDFDRLIAWWAPLLHAVVMGLGSACPIADLARLHDRPEDATGDPRRQLVLDWWGSQLSGFIAWGVATQQDARIQAAVEAAPAPAPSYGSFDRMNESELLEKAQAVGLGFDGGYDPLHLVDHLRLGLSDDRFGQLPALGADLDDSRAAHRVTLDSYASWVDRLRRTPELRGGQVDVLLTGVGRLGTFTVPADGGLPHFDPTGTREGSTPWSGRFSAHTAERIGWYVYALRDPRDDSIFYVGKGRDNRAFEHERSAAADAIVESRKHARILDIQRSGNTVETVILRHRITSEAMAYEVEAAVIDALALVGASLTNLVAGHGVQYGAMTARDLSALYAAPSAPPITEPALLLKIPQIWAPSMSEAELYEATRGWWRLSTRLGPRAKYALTVSKGVIRAAYRIDGWRERVPGDRDYAPDDGGKRLGFYGERTDDLSSLVNRSVTHLRMPSGSPVVYLNCEDPTLPAHSIARGQEAALLAASEVK